VAALNSASRRMQLRSANCGLAVRSFLSVVALAGCNAVLGNDSGVLGPPETRSATSVGATTSASATSGSSGDTGAGGRGGNVGSGGMPSGGAAGGGLSADDGGRVHESGADATIDRDAVADAACATGTLCGSSCVDTSSHPNHCGQCGHACRATYGCTKGQCDSDVVDVASGALMSCALLRGGQAWCWGENQRGQLGDGTIAGTDTCERNVRCRPKPAPVVGADKMPLKDVVQISASFWHACALKKGGAVFCWGSNEQGQLGHSGGDTSCMDENGVAAACNPTPTQVGLPGGISAAGVSVGLRYSCTVTTAGDVYCWGQNNYGQSGLPLTTASTPIPSRIMGLPGRATQIAVADQGDSSCALLGDGTIWCWGNSFHGGTGHDPKGDSSCGTITCNAAPVRINDGHGAAFGGVESIATGRYAGCALRLGFRPFVGNVRSRDRVIE